MIANLFGPGHFLGWLFYSLQDSFPKMECVQYPQRKLWQDVGQSVSFKTSQVPRRKSSCLTAKNSTSIQYFLFQVETHLPMDQMVDFSARLTMLRLPNAHCFNFRGPLGTGRSAGLHGLLFSASSSQVEWWPYAIWLDKKFILPGFCHFTMILPFLICFV